MAVESKSAAANTVQALKVYKDLGLDLKTFKAKCAEIGISVQRAIDKLTDDEVARIKKHLGIAEDTPAPQTATEAPAPTAAELARKAADDARKAAETARLEKEEAARRKAESAEQQRLEALGKRLGVEPSQVEFVGQLLGVEINSLEDIDEALVQRTQKHEVVFKIANEFKIEAREVSRIARQLGIDVGRKGFKGLSPSEEFMLRAMVKQRHTTQEERRAEIQVDKPTDYKPAPPTGNKAVETREVAKTAETASSAAARRERRGRVSTEQTREIIPERFREPRGGQAGGQGGSQAGGAGRSRRERFEVSQLSYDRPRGGRARRRGRGDEEQEEKKIEVPTGPVSVEQPVNLRHLSEAMGIKTSEIMTRMIKEGLPPLRINDSLSKDIIEQIGIIFEREITVLEPKDAETLIAEQLERFDEEGGVEEMRAPIVTIMGHVDHGKTSLLDAIASLDRVSEESGGITQHIGAFRLDLLEKAGKYTSIYGDEANIDPTAKRLRVTFIDTPGHEAFTAMRARGANVTDIAVVVVAADDGIMPQTEEAIAHARAAEVEIVVAITKIDKPEANIMKARQQLAAHNLMSPDWGGNTEIIELSSITKEGVDKLVQVLSDMAELLELKAVAEKPAVGTVLEAHRDTGRGIVATMLVKDGTLRTGDVIVAGHGYGRVRAMQEPRGDGLHLIQSAGPSIPVEVAGLDEMPEAGSLFHGMKDIKKAAEIANMVRQQERELERSRGFSLEDWSKARAGQQVKELLLVLKSDVQGSAETIKQELGKLQHDEVRVKVIHSAVGQITTTDVHLAEAAGGIVVGFHVGVDGKARDLADNHHVDIRTYEIIYKLIEEIRDALAGLLSPERIEMHQGTAVVRMVFKVSKVGRIAGCHVTKGSIRRDSRLRLVRDGAVIYETDVASLKREKDDASEVREGFECGIQLKNYDDVKEGDVIEAFKIEERKRTLS
ncbi:MAG: translation initiation factor IF-2 [Planctomycetes bacterium]|nr:translation initiation factor IF-2 [Planctomycetota bacterium]